MNKTKRKNKGITLIALVITIIVLLILAGVTIASLSGDNGILTRAAESKEKTNKANFDEKVTIVSTELKMGYETNNPVANPKTFLEGKFEEVIDNGDNSYTVKDNPYEAIIDVEGNKIIPVEVGKISTETQKNNYTDQEGKKATIPQGFAVVPGCEIISKGLVISDDPSDTEANTEKIANGAEFVWIPVDTPSEMYGTDGQEKYGILYNFPSPYESKKKYEGKAQGTTYREPDVVAPDESNSLTIDDLKTEFNEMTTSVEKYKGFYIGRYESSLINGSYLAPKYGATSATAAANSANQWYGLYNKQKAYKNPNNSNIKATMIWGCQYDAMLRWLQQSDIDVTANIGDNRNRGPNQKEQEVGTTGTVETDKLNNIYDLYGNGFEWTLEAYYTNCRVYRGGNFYCSYSPAYRNYYNPTNASSYNSTRATLYIP